MFVLEFVDRFDAANDEKVGKHVTAYGHIASRSVLKCVSKHNSTAPAKSRAKMDRTNINIHSMPIT